MSASGLKNAFPRYPGRYWLSVVDNQSLRPMIPLLRFFEKMSFPFREGWQKGKKQYMTGLLFGCVSSSLE
jgi:hypothetical protein